MSARLPHRDVLATTDAIEAAAVAYARSGLFVFPLWPPHRFGGRDTDAAVCCCGGRFRGTRYEPCLDQCKHGIIDHERQMTGGIRGASNDPALTAARWRHWSPAGIGCDLARSGLVVLDVDDNLARDRLAELVATHGPLDAAVSLTGRGEHHWLSLPPGSYRSLRLGRLEVKTTGSAILPPSWHASGVQYRWVVNDPLSAGGFQ